jgi:hypothetical protein
MHFRDNAGQAGHAAFSTSSADLTASRRQLLVLDFMPMGSNKTDRVSPRLAAQGPPTEYVKRNMVTSSKKYEIIRVNL